ncbi:MAG: membrane protein insertase YidC [Gammaproteobacteria bacterium]|nr:membrane protein insertase YidC [Gammaproteobacteria bacterium]
MLENMLDYLRITLFTLLLILGFFVFQAWDQDHPALVLPTPTMAANANHFVPDLSAGVTQVTQAETPMPATAVPAVSSDAKGELVEVTTDRFGITIDTLGGDILAVKLLQYPESLGSKTPYILLNDDPKTRYIAESGLLSALGPDTKERQALFIPEQTTYTLAPNQNELTVRLNWEKDGLKVTKRFTFTRDSYEVKVAYDIDNQANTTWVGNRYTQLARMNTPPESQGGLISLTTFFGAAVSTPQKPFEKLTFKDLQQSKVNTVAKDGWAAMIQHYFISAWVADTSEESHYYSNVTPTGLYSIGMMGPSLTVPPQGKLTTEAKFYAGPTIASELEKTSPTLKLSIDYGWFWFISGIIFWMMQKIYDVVGNWGWSIVLVTIVIKLLFYKLSAKSYRSMSALKMLQPRIELLKERFGEDKQKLTQATLELYRSEKVNPMSGCLPILIQIPVFIALYWVLVESVQLRQAPWILWIHDLSQKDPYYILPLLMGLSMFVQQRLNPPPPDPLQAKVMMAMPIVFTFLFKDFPAGLMLYWFVNNTLSFLQQWHVMRQLTHSSNVKK